MDEANAEVDFEDEEDDAEINASDNRLADDDFATVASDFGAIGAESAASSFSVSSEP